MALISATETAAVPTAGTIPFLAAGIHSEPSANTLPGGTGGSSSPAQQAAGFEASLQRILDALSGKPNAPAAEPDATSQSQAASSEPEDTAAVPFAAPRNAAILPIQTEAHPRSHADSDTRRSVRLRTDRGGEMSSTASHGHTRKPSQDAADSAPIAIPESVQAPTPPALAAQTTPNGISGTPQSPGSQLLQSGSPSAEPAASSLALLVSSVAGAIHPAEKDSPSRRIAESVAANQPIPGDAANPTPSPETPVSAAQPGGQTETPVPGAISKIIESATPTAGAGPHSASPGNTASSSSRPATAHAGQEARTAMQSDGNTPPTAPVPGPVASPSESARTPASAQNHTPPHGGAPAATAAAASSSLLSAALSAPVAGAPAPHPSSPAIQPTSATPSSSPADTFTALDSASTPSTSWIHAGTRHAEAGYLDPSLGWVSARAESAGSALHASIVPGSTEAAQVLGTHLAGLNSYVAERHGTGSQVTMDPPHTGQGSTCFGQPASSSGDESERDTARQNPPRTADDTTGARGVPPTVNPSTAAVATSTIGGQWKHISVMA